MRLKSDESRGGAAWLKDGEGEGRRRVHVRAGIRKVNVRNQV